eukprot:242882-Rhodomonas_salina.1
MGARAPKTEADLRRRLRAAAHAPTLPPGCPHREALRGLGSRAKGLGPRVEGRESRAPDLESRV